MLSKSIWHYFLIVPVGRLGAANAVRADLDNPDTIESTFSPYPDEDPTHYVADFVARDRNSEGKPAKQRLEQLLGSNPQLKNLLWVRSKNAYHPSTPDNEKGIVVASNWAAFPVGAAVSWAAVTEALGRVDDTLPN